MPSWSRAGRTTSACAACACPSTGWGACWPRIGPRRGQVDYLLTKLFHERRGRSYGLLAVHGNREALNQVYATRAASEQFFADVLVWRAGQARRGGGRPGAGAGDSLRVRQPGIIPDGLSEELAKLANCLD